jgi:hypothetical protein
MLTCRGVPIGGSAYGTNLGTAGRGGVADYGVPMSTTAASDPEPQGRAPFADGSPAQVRAALIPEDVAPFDRQWLEGMAKATEHLDLTEVLGVAPRRLADHSQSTRRLPQNARPGRPYVAHR